MVQAPSDVLSSVSKPVEMIDKSIKKLLKEMEQALSSATDPDGVGLAAPQIGKSLQIFIVKEDPEAELKVYINPKIESFKDLPKTKSAPAPKVDESELNETNDGKLSETKTTKKSGKTKDQKPKKGVQLEGCLSLQDIWGVVKRHDELVLSYQDEKGAKHTKTFDGFLSVIIQHEVDHLQGILFPKRVLEQKNILYKSVKNKKGETEFEEIEI